MTAAMAAVCTADVARAQSTQRPARPPRPETVTLNTKDFVPLEATYFASTREKKATPVVLLHDYKDTRKVFAEFAQRLQRPESTDGVEHESFAVLTVDLRGHGDSTKQVFPNGRERELDAARLTTDDLLAMIRFDMEAVRRYLLEKNDEGELNLNKLCLIGVGMGASIATNWAARDWSAPALPTGKQGQDVKALVLVSPRWKYRGVTIQQALRHRDVRSQLAILLLYGKKDADTTGDVRRIYRQLDRFHPEPRHGATESRDLLDVGMEDTSLQGTQLVRELGESGEDQIIKFLSDHVDKVDHQWIKGRGWIYE